MRIYVDDKEREVVAVLCNQCGKELEVENGIVKEGCFYGDMVWGYFSEKDGQKHHFDLCEDCYNKMVSRFKIPVQTTEENELC